MYLFNPSDFAVHKTHFDAVGVGRGVGQNIAYDPVCKSTACLVLFENYCNTHAAFDLFTLFSIHSYALTS